MDEKTPLRIAIVDDDASVRRTLELFIGRTEGMQVVGSFADAQAALQGIPAAQPQVVLMDIRMPGMSGIECTRRLKRVLPATKVLMVTALHEVDTFWEAVRAGAEGFLTKPIRIYELKSAIRKVMSNGHPVSPGFSGKLAWWISPPATTLSVKIQLSERDMEIIALAGDGLGDKQIADVLGISLPTVAWHWTKIFHTLNVHNRGPAIVQWLDRRQAAPKPLDSEQPPKA